MTLTYESFSNFAPNSRRGEKQELADDYKVTDDDDYDAFSGCCCCCLKLVAWQ
jgi:hypothetical protein